MKYLKISTLIFVLVFLCYQCITKAPYVLLMYGCVEGGNSFNWKTLKCEPGPHTKSHIVEYQQSSATLCYFVLAYKEDFGSLPSNLDDLKGIFKHDTIDWSGVTKLSIDKEIIDPYSGSNYIYRKVNNNDFIVYSVGPDGKDDGGEEFDSTRSVGDIIICPVDAIYNQVTE